MTAQAKYITSVIETFSTYLESLNVSSQLNEETTALFIKFLKQKENYDSWPMHTLEKFLETEKPSSNAVVLIKRFVKDFTPYQTDIFLHKFLSELKAENKSASTIKNYRSDISGMISLVGVNKIADLFTRKNVKSFVKDQFAKNLKVGTVKRKLVSITQFAEWAESKGLVKNVSFWIGDVEGLFENSGKDGYKQKTASKETGFCKPTGLPLGKLDNLDISLTKNSNLSSDNPFRGDVEIGGIEPKDATTLLEEFLVNLEINGSSKSTVKNYKSDISQLVNFVDQKLDRKVGNKTKTTSEEVGFCKPTSLPLGRLDKSELSITRNINLSIINSNKGDVEIGGIEPPRLDLSSQPGKPAIPTSRGNISQINKQIKPKTYPLVLIITQENLREFVAFQTSKGLKQNSIKRKLVSISQFSAWAEQRGELKNTSLWMNAVQNNKPYLHNIELKLKKQTKSNRWSLPMPGFVKNKTGIGTRLGITNHKTKEGSHDYASRLKKSLKDFATSINAKKNKTFLPYFNLVMIALFLLGVGYFGYQQFVKQAPDSLAYPTTPVRPNRELSFQGRLTDTAQNPITTASNMAFRLYDTGPGTGGTLLWDSSTCSVTPDQDGIFNVGLGDDCGAEISENVFTENSNVWLEVDVVSETLTPRQSIKTVAYAINSETVQGYPVSATGAATTNTILVMDSAGQVLLGEVSPTLKSTTGTFSIEAQALTLQTSSGSNGDIILDPDDTGEVLSTGYFYAPGATFAATYAGGTSLVLRGGPGGTGNIQEWQDSSGTVLSVVDESGNVGVGTTDPQKNLHIQSENTSTSQLRLQNTAAGAGNYTLDIGMAWQDQSFSINTGGTNIMKGYGYFDTDELAIGVFGHEESIYINTNGNVGIGTTSPLFLLDVAGTASVNSLNINDSYTFPTADGSVDYILQTDGAGAVSWEDPSNITGAGLWANTLNLFHPKNELASVVDLALGGTSTASANIHLKADGQAYFAGNVGVGTTVPGANLEVYETGANATFNLTRDSGATIQGIASTTWASLGTSGGQTFALRSNGTDRISLDTNGDISFNSGDVFFENSSGNVGIGTTAPGALFEVNGTENVAKARITSTSSGAQSYAQATGGLELTATGMNTTYKYTPIIKFGSTDPELTTLNPKFLAGIAGYATETYDGDTKGGMGIEFFTTDNAQGVSTTPTSRMVIDSGGNVGIGTTVPGTKLEVNSGTTNTVSRFISSDAGSTIAFKDNTTSNSYLGLGALGDDLLFYSAAGNENMRIQGGNLGIGDSTPDAPLDVVGDVYISDGLSLYETAVSDGTVEATKFCTGDGETNCVTDFSSLGGGSSLFTDGGTITYLTSTTDDLALGGTGSTSPFFFDESAEILTLTNTTAGDSFRVNDVASDTTPFIIDADGNVGVGTTGPLAQLHIVQNQNDAIYNEMTAMGASDKRAFRTAITSNTSSAVNIYGLEVYDNNSIAGATVYGVYVNIDDPDTTNYGIYSAGGVNYFSDNVGIGTSSPTKTLDVVGNTLITPDTGGVVIDQNNNNIALSVKGGGSGINIAQFIRDVGATANINLSGSGGEPQIVFDTVESSSPWAIGVDDGAESFNIAQNSAIGTNDFFTILTSGNVGIGTTAPAQKLTISQGDIQIDHTTFANQDGIIYKSSNTFIHNFNYGDNGTVTTNGANTFVGASAGNLTMGSTATLAWQGSYNTGIGQNSLSNLTTGYANIGMGYATLNLTTTGAGNTAIGDYSLRSSTGNSNSALGRYSLLNITSGSNNIALGAYSGRYESDGSTSLTSLNNSVLIGYNAKANASGDTNEIAIGYDVTGLGSNTAVLGNSSITTTALRGNVGIGTTSPNAPLEINNSTSMALNITGTPASDWDHGLWLDGKAAVTEGGDSGWLRLNQNNSFTLGTYTPGAFRADGSLLVDTSTVINDSALTINDANRYIWTPASGWGEYWNTTDNAIEFYGGGSQVGEIDLDNGYISGERFVDNSNSSYFLDPAAGGDSLIVAGNVGIGTTSPSANLDVAGTTVKFGPLSKEYRYKTGGSTDTNWKKIADITLTTGSYRAASFEVQVVNANTNFGSTSNAIPLKYYVSAYRSAATQDDSDTGSVSGPVADYVRLVKTATGVYELQVRQIASWKHQDFTVQEISSIATITYADTPADGSTTGTIYTATTTHYDYFTNGYFAGNVGIGTTSPTQALDVVGNITTSGQLQVGGYASTPTAIGEGSMIFNTTTNTHQCYNGTSWYNCGGTLYSNTNASVASGSYITVNHDLASTDLLSNAWINSQSTWKMLDANYQPAIAWEGKDTQKGIYRNAVNSYSPGNETGADTSTLHDGYLFDTFEDETKTDDTNTTVSIATQQGDDGSSNFTTLDQRVQDGRVGLAGGQTMSTATTDNAGNTYLGSNAVNDIYYYDRARDSIPEVQVELGIDPNWYNGVTLSVATSSATFSQNSTVPDVNPNLTTTYNGSLVKASGRYSSGGQTIFATIKSPTTYDWTDYNGEAATGVSIDPGTSQALGATGVSLTFTGTNYNVGDVFKVASWFVETTGSTRGGKQQFPERSNVITESFYVDIIDIDTQKLWMRINATSWKDSAGSSSSEVLNGILYKGDASGIRRFDFTTDTDKYYFSTNGLAKSDVNTNIASRNTAGTALNIINSSLALINATVNDVSAAVIPNQPTQEMTVSGWGYIEGDGTDQIEETVTLPYKFESIPNITVSSAGYYSNGGPTPTSLLDCNGTALSNDGSNTQSSDITTNNFQLNHGRYIGTFSATAYFCYTWTATGTVSPKQFVAVATGASGADGGTTIINETDKTSIDVSIGSQYAHIWRQNKVSLTSDGDLYLGIHNGTSNFNSVDAYHGIAGITSDETTIAEFRSGYYLGGFTNTLDIGTFLDTYTTTDPITSLEVTENTSTYERGNTIYVGTDAGATVIQEKSKSNCGTVSSNNFCDGLAGSDASVKYYTKDYISEEMVGDIRGMWPLNGNNTASDFEDVSVKANNLTGTNITSADAVSGVRGEAYDFDGSTEYLSCTDAACGGTSDLDITDDMTVSAWINPGSLTGNHIIISKGDGGTAPFYSYRFYTTGTDLVFNFYNGTNYTSTGTGVIPNTDTWYHVAGRYDGSTIKVYVNGQEVSSTTAVGGSLIDNTGDFYIGAVNHLGSVATHFNGLIDEPFVTATAISAQKIKQMYEVGSRALESHGTNLGGGSADANQNLSSITNNNYIYDAKPDWNNQYMYVTQAYSLTPDTSSVSRIQLNSDTNIKTYVESPTSNIPSGGPSLPHAVKQLSVGYTLNAVGSAVSGVKTMGFDDYSTATTGNFVSKTTTLPNNIGSAVLWVSPILDSDDGSNTLTVTASNDNGSTYDTCTLVDTDNNHAVPEKEYACTFTAGGNDLKVKFEFARGSTKTNTYITQYGISWLGETGFRIEQADNNNVRLYNYSGESQNLKLNVTGAGTATLATPWTDGGSYLYATGYETLRMYDGGGTNYVSLSHDGTVGNIGIDGSTSMSFDSSGNVGIGTTAPDSQLTMVGNNNVLNIENTNVSAGSGGVLRFGHNQLSSTLPMAEIRGELTNGEGAGSRAGDLSFWTSTLGVLSEKMRIASNGFVGIGTTSPGAKLQIGTEGGGDSTGTLHLAGSDAASNGAEGGEIRLFTADDYDTTYNYYFMDAYQDDLRIGRAGSGTDLLLTSDGNVGIGITSPAFKLDVAGTTRFGTTSLTDSAAFQFAHSTLTTGQVSMYIDVQDTGASDEYFMQLIRGSSVDNEFLFRTDGTAHADGSFTGGGADVAEYYYLQDSTEEGDLVSIPTSVNSNFPAGKTLEKSSGSSYDGSVIGIVSTNPGLVAGGGNAEIDNTYTNQKPIALAGRVPVKVSVENGEIKKGDPLTSSSTPGVAMKASSAGQIIGRALEDYDGTQQISDGVLIVENERLETFTYSDPIPSPNEGIGKIMTFVNTTYHDPNIYLTDTGNLIINKNPDTDQYLVTDNLTNNLIDTVGTFAQIVVADIKAGLITAKQINSEELISPIINTSKINTASSVTISRNTNLESEDPVLVVDGSFTAGKTSLTSLLTQEATISGNLAVTGSTTISNSLDVSGTTTLLGDLYTTNINSATLSATTITTTHLEATSSRITALEVGMAELENIKATTAEIVNATVSGTLYASNIYDFETQIANSLQTPGLLDLITGQNESTASANYLAELYETTNSSGFEAIAMADLDLTLDELSLTETDVVLTGSALFIEKYFKVNGAGFISDSLAVGNSIFAGNAVVIGSGDSTTQISNGIIAYTTPNPNDQILKIQPTGLGSIELLAGLVTLDDSGLVRVNGNFETTGNAKIGGTLLTDLIQPSSFDNPFQVQVAGIDTETSEVKESRFEIINEVGTPVATFSAQGSAKFAGTVEVEGGISIGSENLGASATNELETNKTAGTAIIASGASQVKIESNLITDNTMIYVTAVGSTNNQVMFVKSQLPHLITTAEYTQGDVIPPLSTVIPATSTEPAMLKTITQQGEFTVGFDNVTVGEVSFNWWVVN